jgi:hypothetical protein
MSRLFLLINIETHLIRALDRLRLPCVVAPPTLILMTPGRWITDAACEGEGMDRCARGSIWDRDPAPVKKCHRVIPKDVLAHHHDDIVAPRARTSGHALSCRATKVRSWRR